MASDTQNDKVNERLFVLERELGMAQKRIGFLETSIAKTNKEFRAEAMTLLGATLKHVGERLLVQAQSEKEYQVVFISDKETVNEQTFYAYNSGDKWEFSVMEGGAMTSIDADTLHDNMKQAIARALSQVPAETTSTAFNLYVA